MTRLRPSIQAAVGAALVRCAPMGDARNLREEAKDLCQDVFRVLFERDGRVLRSWSPDRGASLQTFVRLVAQRHALSVLRTKRRNPWSEEPMIDVDQMQVDPVDPESLVATRQVWRLVVDELRRELSPKGLAIFELLIVEQASVDRVRQTFGLSRDAVYAWRSRLAKTVREKVVRHLSESSGSPRMVSVEEEP